MGQGGKHSFTCTLDRGEHSHFQLTPPLTITPPNPNPFISSLTHASHKRFSVFLGAGSAFFKRLEGSKSQKFYPLGGLQRPPDPPAASRPSLLKVTRTQLGIAAASAEKRSPAESALQRDDFHVT